MVAVATLKSGKTLMESAKRVGINQITDWKQKCFFG
jgi:hypothetical protein